MSIILDPNDVAILAGKKKQPRRIILEDTGDRRKPKIGEYVCNSNMFYKVFNPENYSDASNIWREIKESDLLLNNGEHKLSLSAEECKSLLDTIDVNVVRKIQQFLKEVNDDTTMG